jgi:hypothetical protein
MCWFEGKKTCLEAYFLQRRISGSCSFLESGAVRKPKGGLLSSLTHLHADNKAICVQCLEKYRKPDNCRTFLILNQRTWRLGIPKRKWPISPCVLC